MRIGAEEISDEMVAVEQERCRPGPRALRSMSLVARTAAEPRTIVGAMRGQLKSPIRSYLYIRRQPCARSSPPPWRKPAFRRSRSRCSPARPSSSRPSGSTEFWPTPWPKAGHPEGAVCFNSAEGATSMGAPGLDSETWESTNLHPQGAVAFNPAEGGGGFTGCGKTRTESSFERARVY